MRNSFFHAARTFANLSVQKQRLIRDDWFRVIQTAEDIRTGDGLVDSTIPRTLKEWGIEKRTRDEYFAYHRMLFNYFLFGEDSKAKSAARRSRGVS